MKAMRLFQSVAVALLQRFLSIRQKTFGCFEQYSKQLIYIQLLHTRWTISSSQHSWFTSLSPQGGKVKSNWTSWRWSEWWSISSLLDMSNILITLLIIWWKCQDNVDFVWWILECSYIRYVLWSHCHQNWQKGAKRNTTSADLVKECISHVQFLIEGE